MSVSLSTEVANEHLIVGSVCSVSTLDKERVPVTLKTKRDFITLHRTAWKLKHVSCSFPEFSISTFQWQLTEDNWNYIKQKHDEGGRTTVFHN